jgi:hypothetical protein
MLNRTTEVQPRFALACREEWAQSLVRAIGPSYRDAADAWSGTDVVDPVHLRKLDCKVCRT